MPYKDPEVHKANARIYAAKYYLKNKEAIIKATSKKNKATRAAWAVYKETLSCTVCGFSHPAALDFHHPPGTKEESIHTLVRRNSKRLLQKELAKCIVLCANCHRIHHYDEHKATVKRRKKKTLEAP